MRCFYFLFVLVLLGSCNGEDKIQKFYKSGEIKAEYVEKNGKISGIYKEFYKNGKLKKKTHYLDGVKHGRSVLYYKSGNIQQEFNYKNGEKNGWFKKYDEDGGLLQKANYKDGDQHGESKLFYDDGSLRSITNYKKSKISGKFIEFYPGGNVLMEAFLKNDTLLYFTKFTEDGAVNDNLGYININSVKDTVGFGDNVRVKLETFGFINDSLSASLIVSASDTIGNFESIKILNGSGEYSFQPINQGKNTLHINIKTKSDTIIKSKEFYVTE